MASMSEFSDLPFDHFTPGPMVEEGFTARAGQPLPDGSAVASTDEVVEAISTVYDPEIPVNIYELGLIYELDIDAKDGSVSILMTLTAPGCPVAGVLPGQVAEAAAGVGGVGEVAVTLTWDPAWDKDRMSEDAQLALGIF
jgi:FeS assembly SUF system protein